MPSQKSWTKVVVYIPARAGRELKADGHDPAEWARDVVKAALEERAEARSVGERPARSSSANPEGDR